MSVRFRTEFGSVHARNFFLCISKDTTNPYHDSFLKWVQKGNGRDEESLKSLSQWMIEKQTTFDFQVLFNTSCTTAGLWVRRFFLPKGLPLPGKKDDPRQQVSLPKFPAAKKKVDASKAGPSKALPSKVQNAGAIKIPASKVQKAGPSKPPVPAMQESVQHIPDAVDGQQQEVVDVPGVGDGGYPGFSENQRTKKRARVPDGAVEEERSKKHRAASPAELSREDEEREARAQAQEEARKAQALESKKTSEIAVEVSSLKDALVFAEYNRADKKINTFIAMEDQVNRKELIAQLENDPDIVSFIEFAAAKKQALYSDIFRRLNGGMFMREELVDRNEYDFPPEPYKKPYRGFQVSKTVLKVRVDAVRGAFEIRIATDPSVRLCFYEAQRLWDQFCNDDEIRAFVEARDQTREMVLRVEKIIQFYSDDLIVGLGNIEQFKTTNALLNNLVVQDLLPIPFESFKAKIKATCDRSIHHFDKFVTQDDVERICTEMNVFLKCFGLEEINIPEFVSQRAEMIEYAGLYKRFDQAMIKERDWGQSFQQKFEAWPGLWKDMLDIQATFESAKYGMKKIMGDLIQAQQHESDDNLRNLTELKKKIQELEDKEKEIPVLKAKIQELEEKEKMIPILEAKIQELEQQLALARAAPAPAEEAPVLPAPAEEAPVLPAPAEKEVEPPALNAAFEMIAETQFDPDDNPMTNCDTRPKRASKAPQMFDPTVPTTSKGGRKTNK